MSVADSKNNIDLDELYKNVIEDDKTQPDPNMSLQLDSTLIRKFYGKLEPQMKINLMNLLRSRLQNFLRENERVFDDHNFWNR